MKNNTCGFQDCTDKLKYNARLGYFRNESQYDYGYWDKITFRLNTEYKFNNIVKAGVELAPRYESWDDTPGLFGNIMSMDPTTPIYRAQEDWVSNPYDNYSRSHNNETWNPVASVARMNGSTHEYGLLANPFIQIDPIKGLVLRSQFGLNARFRVSDNFSPEFFIDVLEKNYQNVISRSMNEWVDWNTTNTITYITTINQKHNLNVMGGFTAERFANYWVSGSRDAIPNSSESLQEVGAGTLNQQSNGNSSYSTLVSYIARGMYNYDNRYYITASLRVDGSSKFSADNRYAAFQSLSGAWRIMGEPFMKEQTVFSDLKLRAGWGKVGNQNIDNAAYLTLLGTSGSDYVFGTTPNRLPGTSISSVGNNSLKWETVEDINVGLDMSFLDSRLGFTLDVFEKRSKDMLYRKQNIYAAGYPDWNCQVWSNIGSMKSSGWELSLNWRDQVKDFNYGIGLNLSKVKSEAVKFSGDGPVWAGNFKGSQIVRNVDGGEISRFRSEERRVGKEGRLGCRSRCAPGP